MPYKYDVSLPLPHLYPLVARTRERFQDRPDVSVVGYGHLGDCNLHLNVGAPSKADADVLGRLEPWVFEQVGACAARTAGARRR